MNLASLVSNLFERQKYLRADKNQYTVCVRHKSAVWLVLQAFPHIIKGLEKRSTLVDLAITVGRRIRQKLKLKPDGVAACQLGFFVLISFFEVGLLTYKLNRIDKKSGRKSKYMTYEIVLKDKDALFSIWDEIKDEEGLDLYPTNTPPDDWVTGIHSTGAGLVKKGTPEVLKLFSAKNQPIVFNSLNKVSKTPWLVNLPMIAVIEYYSNQPDGLENPLAYKQETNEQKRQSKFIVVDSCLRIAKHHQDKLMYSLYSCDFR
jgi:hypothetical protein